jgi:hypothetical protein
LCGLARLLLPVELAQQVLGIQGWQDIATFHCDPSFLCCDHSSLLLLLLLLLNV